MIILTWHCVLASCQIVRTLVLSLGFCVLCVVQFCRESESFLAENSLLFLSFDSEADVICPNAPEQQHLKSGRQDFNPMTEIQEPCGSADGITS